jgi:hypothetical protein
MTVQTTLCEYYEMSSEEIPSLTRRTRRNHRRAVPNEKQLIPRQTRVFRKCLDREDIDTCIVLVSYKLDLQWASMAMDYGRAC